MTLSSAHASKFYEQIARERRVFTLMEHDSFLVFPMRDVETVPFWSSRSRVERIQASHPKYGSCEIRELTLEHFVEHTLARLEDEGIHVGVNWSGERMTGYDLSASRLRTNYWIEKLGNPDS